MKQTVIDQIEIRSDGFVSIRFGLLRDGAEPKWHRTAVEPGGDVDAQLALVNQHLVSMGEAPVDAAGIPRLKRICEVTHTPDVVEPYRAAVLAQIHEQEEQDRAAREESAKVEAARKAAADAEQKRLVETITAKVRTELAAESPRAPAPRT